MTNVVFSRCTIVGWHKKLMDPCWEKNLMDVFYAFPVVMTSKDSPCVKACSPTPAFDSCVRKDTKDTVSVEPVNANANRSVDVSWDMTLPSLIWL